MPTETINVYLEMRDKLTGNLLKTTKRVEEFNEKMKRSTAVVTTFNKKGKQVIETVKIMKGNFQRFRMELLSVMFGSMMVSNALFGLITPALAAVGAFELWNATLQILFLPTAMDLLNNFFVPAIQAVADLDPGIQKLIGSFVLFGGGLFKVVEIGAEVSLFAAGLSVVWSKLAVATQASILLWGGWVGAILLGIGVLVIFALQLKNMRTTFDTVFKDMKKHPGILGLLDVFDGLIKRAYSLYSAIVQLNKLKGNAAMETGVYHGPATREGNLWSKGTPEGYTPQGVLKSTIQGPTQQVGTVNSNITNNVSASSQLDVNALTKQITDQITKDLDRLVRR